MPDTEKRFIGLALQSTSKEIKTAVTGLATSETEFHTWTNTALDNVVTNQGTIIEQFALAVGAVKDEVTKIVKDNNNAVYQVATTNDAGEAIVAEYTLGFNADGNFGLIYKGEHTDVTAPTAPTWGQAVPVDPFSDTPPITP